VSEIQLVANAHGSASKHAARKAKDVIFEGEQREVSYSSRLG
jgi:hypothetical protein